MYTDIFLYKVKRKIYEIPVIDKKEEGMRLLISSELNRTDIRNRTLKHDRKAIELTNEFFAGIKI